MDEAPGWDAIEVAVGPLVGDAGPRHWGTGTGLPDQDGLWGVSAYELSDHILYVTFGLTELFSKVSDDLAVSGWGMELTMRVLRDVSGPVPEWPVRLLARLGELVFERSTPFLPSGRLEIPDGDAVVPPSVCWTEDPLLSPVSGPFGEFSFVATVGVSRGLLAEMRETTTATVLERLRDANPLLIVGGPGLRW